MSYSLSYNFKCDSKARVVTGQTASVSIKDRDRVEGEKIIYKYALNSHVWSSKRNYSKGIIIQDHVRAVKYDEAITKLVRNFD